MSAADVWCVPSRWEGFGSILVEAMALGVPTVSTKIGPICEVAGPDPWLRLSEPNDPESLASEIIKAIGRPDESRGLSDKGVERFNKQYTAEAVAMSMLGFFDRAISGSRNHHHDDSPA